jgi:hypothetical protein
MTRVLHERRWQTLNDTQDEGVVLAASSAFLEQRTGCRTLSVAVLEKGQPGPVNSVVLQAFIHITLFLEKGVVPFESRPSRKKAADRIINCRTTQNSSGSCAVSFVNSGIDVYALKGSSPSPCIIRMGKFLWDSLETIEGILKEQDSVPFPEDKYFARLSIAAQPAAILYGSIPLLKDTAKIPEVVAALGGPDSVRVFYDKLEVK